MIIRTSLFIVFLGLAVFLGLNWQKEQTNRQLKQFIADNSITYRIEKNTPRIQSLGALGAKRLQRLTLPRIERKVALTLTTGIYSFSTTEEIGPKASELIDEFLTIENGEIYAAYLLKSVSAKFPDVETKDVLNGDFTIYCSIEPNPEVRNPKPASRSMRTNSTANKSIIGNIIPADSTPPVIIETPAEIIKPNKTEIASAAGSLISGLAALIMLAFYLKDRWSRKNA